MVFLPIATMFLCAGAVRFGDDGDEGFVLHFVRWVKVRHDATFRVWGLLFKDSGGL